MHAQPHVSRRSFCAGAAAMVTTSAAAADTDPRSDHGRVSPPLSAPEIALTPHDRPPTTLPALLKGRATALQLMFTACATACPIEGATFARVQKLLPDQVARGIQLLSLSVDPKHDTPEALRAWLQRFHAVAGWIAAAPTIADVDRLKEFAGAGRNPADNHSTQVLMVNREARLVWRTFELPDAQEIASMLAKM
jgi:protein SCO1/2